MAEYAFSLQLALDYLSQNGTESHVTPEGYYKLVRVPLNQSASTQVDIKE